MAKSNRNKGKPRPTGGAQSSTAPAVSKVPRAPAVSKANGEVHVKVPSTDAKAAAVMQPTELVAAAPVTQVSPAKASTIDAAAEEWADPLADNSSYATADSDDPLSAAGTPPAVASTDAVETRVVPDAPVAWPDLSDIAVSTAITSSAQASAAVLAAPAPGTGAVPFSTSADAATAMLPVEPTPAAPPAAVPAAAPAAAGTGFKSFDMADEAALVKAAAGESAISWGQCLDWLLCAYTYPVRILLGMQLQLLVTVNAVPHGMITQTAVTA